MLRSVDGLTIGADDLDEMRDQSSVYDDLHVEAEAGTRP